MRISSFSVPVVSKYKIQQKPSFSQIIDYGTKDPELIYVPILYDDNDLTTEEMLNKFSDPNYNYVNPFDTMRQHLQGKKDTNSNQEMPKETKQKSGKSLGTVIGLGGGGLALGELGHNAPNIMDKTFEKVNDAVDSLANMADKTVDNTADLANKTIDSFSTIREKASDRFASVKENMHEKLHNGNQDSANDIDDTHHESVYLGVQAGYGKSTADESELMRNNPDFNHTPEIDESNPFYSSENDFHSGNEQEISPDENFFLG